MNCVRKLALSIVTALMFCGILSAEIVMYSATDGAGGNPDAIDGMGASVDLWAATTVGGGSNGNFLGNSGNNAGGSSGAGAGTSAWGLFSSGGSGNQSFMDATFSPLIGRNVGNVNDSVSIDFDNGFIDGGQSVGIQFFDGGSLQTELKYTGGGLDAYEIFDGGGTTSTGQGFTGDGFNVTVTKLIGGNNYRMDITGAINATHTGTFATGSGFLTSIRVFNFNAGGGSNFDVYSNNLTINAVPEPSSLMMFGIGLFALARRKRS